MNLMIKEMKEEDIDQFAVDLREAGVPRDSDYFRFCFDEAKMKKRVVFMALLDGKAVGAGHFLFESKYPPFKDQHIPEINDLIVAPILREHGIGGELMNTIENFALSKGYEQIGLGVGLYKDYGIAQRLYVKRGYIPDGNGIFYDYKEVEPGEMVRLDDDLILYLIKHLV